MATRVKNTPTVDAPVLNGENATNNGPEVSFPVPGDMENVANSGKPETNDSPENTQDETTGDNAQVELTSEKLIEIRKEIDEAFDAMEGEKDRFKKLGLISKITDLQDAEKAEINAIKRAKADQELQAKRNERIALVDKMLELYDDFKGYKSVFDTMPEVEKEGEPGVMVKPQDAQSKLDGLYHEYKNVRETIENELLARVGIKVTANNGTPAVQNSEPKGEIGKKIQELYAANRALGMRDADNVKAIIAAGFSRGTTGTEAKKYRDAHGLEIIK